MKLLILSMLILSSVAIAENKTFTWTNPVANTDGSAFDALTEMAEARIYCREGGQSNEVLFVAPGFGNNLHTVDFLPGDYTCDSTAVNLVGVESFRSNSVTFVILPPPPTVPNSPTGFGVIPVSVD